MKIVIENKKQKRKIIYNIKEENAVKFHIHFLQKKIFSIFIENKDLSYKLYQYFKNSLKIRRRKIYTKGLLMRLKRIKREDEEKCEEIMGKLKEHKKVRNY
jgi:hypothetical protein